MVNEPHVSVKQSCTGWHSALVTRAVLLGLVLTLGSAAFMYNRWSVQRH